MSPSSNLIMIAVLGGATGALAFVVAVFFARYWRDTRDRLFLFFTWAFVVLGANRIALSFLRDDEIRTYLYWIRLFAYLLILVAILDKNRRAAAAQE